jgi:hypothetical protein
MQTSAVAVREELNKLLREVEASVFRDLFIGTLNAHALRMPFSASDGRVCTWTKKFTSIAGRVENEVSSDTVKSHCWLVRLMASEKHYALFKLGDTAGSLKGSSSSGLAKYKLHRVLFALLTPEYHSSVTNKDEKLVGIDNHCAHRCGNGFQKSDSTELVCINPHHIKWTTCKDNQSMKVGMLVVFFVSRFRVREALLCLGSSGLHVRFGEVVSSRPEVLIPRSQNRGTQARVTTEQ